MSEVIHRLLESMFGMEENLKIYSFLYMLISTDPTIVSPCVGKIHWELELLPEVNTFLNSIKIIVF